MGDRFVKNVAVITDDECTGCLACYNVCDFNAITSALNDEGFYRPVIDFTKCKGCGICLNKCPAANFKTINDEVNENYAFINKNDSQRTKSSSGGFFYILAEHILKSNGTVFAAKFDDEYKVVHDSFSKINDIEQFLGSKYSQSYIGNGYKTCKAELDKGKPVLFVGTPCQIAGLLSYLPKKYSNLITADFICHGIPSSAVWINYLKYRENLFSSKISAINFRNKQISWEKYLLSIDFANGYKYTAENDIDVFMNLFLDDVILQKSCYNCKFKSKNRVSDFTMADFWGIQSILPSFFDSSTGSKGISLVIIHSKKATEIFAHLNNQAIFEKLTTQQFERAIQINASLIKSARKPYKRKKIKTYINSTNGFYEYNKTPKTTVGILNHVFSNNNYGALMVAFAMEKLVEEYGYNPLSIYLDLDKNYSDNFSDFRNKYLHITKPLKPSQLKKLNSLADTFIIGSDQVWRNWFNNFDIFSTFFAAFADSSKKIISYAASFGIKTFPESEINKAKIKNLLSAFSSISVREKSGIDILKDEFNLYSEFVLDPTLLVNKSYYEKIMREHTDNFVNKDFFTTMIFPGESSDKEGCRNAIKELADSKKLNIVNVLDIEKHYPIPDWLYLLTHSDFNIIDSFHGLVFSLIFHKNFVCITNTEGGNERFFSLLSICKLEKKLIEPSKINFNTLDKILSYEIDWTDVDNKLEQYKIYSRNFLLDALSKRVVCNSKILYDKKILEKGISFLIRCIKFIFRKFKRILNIFIK